MSPKTSSTKREQSTEQFLRIPPDRAAPLPGSSLRHPGGPSHAGHGGQLEAKRRGGPHRRLVMC